MEREPALPGAAAEADKDELMVPLAPSGLRRGVSLSPMPSEASASAAGAAGGRDGPAPSLPPLLSHTTSVSSTNGVPDPEHHLPAGRMQRQDTGGEESAGSSGNSSDSEPSEEANGAGGMVVDAQPIVEHPIVAALPASSSAATAVARMHHIPCDAAAAATAAAAAAAVPVPPQHRPPVDIDRNGWFGLCEILLRKGPKYAGQCLAERLERSVRQGQRA